MGVNESEGLGNLQLKLTQSAITNVSIFSFFEITVFSLSVSGTCYTAFEATLPRFPVAVQQYLWVIRTVLIPRASNTDAHTVRVRMPAHLNELKQSSILGFYSINDHFK